MRAYEILLERVLLERSTHTRVNYGKYLLVHANELDKNNFYVGHVYDSNKKLLNILSNQNLDALKDEFIKLVIDHERNELKKSMEKREKVSASDIQKAALNLNTAFTTNVFKNEVPTAIRLVSDGGKMFIDVMTLEYFDMNGVADDKSFKKVSDRQWSKRARTKIYGISNINPVKLEQMGFEFHGVYDLTDEISPEPDEFRRYSLDLISYSDKQKSYSFPTITIAFWYKKNSSYSRDTL